MTDYERFIASKTRVVKPMGFDVRPEDLNPRAKDWQRVGVAWAVKRGRAALFWECGLGKTISQLMWGEQIVLREQKPGLLLCPIGVRQQTIDEAKKFGISVPVQAANSRADVTGPGLWVTNYEKLHKFDPSEFVLVILDESGCLKEFKSKTRRDLCEKFADTPYRLACTATPAPNAWMELGNHCEFLGVMPSNEMLSRWFINDTMRAGEYKLLGHAANDFWRWVCGWALCLSKPSDMGDYSDEGYALPPIEYTFETVDVEHQQRPGELFPIEAINVHTMHREKRESCAARSVKVAEIVASDREDFWAVWCDTDYEADELMEVLPDAVEVRGSMPERRKEEGIAAFARAKTRIFVSKPDIAGYGCNFQHCRNVVFVGLSYSFEKFYQATRRFWRFGQQRPVRVWIVQGEAEAAIAATVFRKADAHAAMQASMAEAMKDTQIELLQSDRALSKYQPTIPMEIPSWLRRSAASKKARTGVSTKAIAARS
jgi:hypothetical protein